MTAKKPPTIWDMHTIAQRRLLQRIIDTAPGGATGDELLALVRAYIALRRPIR